MTQVDIKISNALRDKNNVNIINTASRGFSKIIGKDEVESCKLMALWKALENFDETRGMKFTSYLYRYVRYTCLREVSNQRKYREKLKLEKQASENHLKRCYTDDHTLFDISTSLSDEEKELLDEKIQEKSISELCLRYGVKKTAMNKKIGRLVSKITAM